MCVSVLIWFVRLCIPFEHGNLNELKNFCLDLCKFAKKGKKQRKKKKERNGIKLKKRREMKYRRNECKGKRKPSDTTSCKVKAT
jgi:hypothetical protein